MADKPGGGDHLIDCLVTGGATGTTDLLVSCKTQNVGGTAEEKIPYEVIKLMSALHDHPELYGNRAVLIMEGQGWSPTMRTFVENHLAEWVPGAGQQVTIYRDAEKFVRTEFPTRYVPPVNTVGSSGGV